MKELKIGDRVKVYNGNYEIIVGKIHSFTASDYIDVFKDGDDFCHLSGPFHRKQVRLITKEKVKPITRSDLKNAYNNCTPANRVNSDLIFIKELERIIGRGIK